MQFHIGDRSGSQVARGWFGAAAAAGMLLFPSAALIAAPAPIQIERQGSFAAGGTTIGDPAKASLACDHGVVEYQIPPRARGTALFLWHSSAAAVWQRRWDGGEGYQSIMLRRGFPTYVWDGPRVGRATWGCAPYPYEPSFGRDQGNFISWRLGAAYPDFFPGVQFPTKDPEAWNQAIRARYQEFDTIPNAQIESDAAAKALDRVGPSVLLTNSAGGFRALLTGLKSDKVKAIVAYENPGYVFPEGEGPAPGRVGPFGPVFVSAAEFAKLTRFPIQFVWGDNIDKSERWASMLALCRQFVEIVNRHGGKAEILLLPEAGLKGNTHIPFADLNNVAVADQLSLFLKKHKLDR